MGAPRMTSIWTMTVGAFLAQTHGQRGHPGLFPELHGFHGGARNDDQRFCLMAILSADCFGYVATSSERFA
jgi:hypothetical protein